METEYFETKFQKCENCENFAPTLKMNWARKIRYDENLKKLWESDKPELEKRFLLAHMIEPSFQTVLDLYWYYEDGWIQVSNKPEQTVCIDVELPTLGQAKEGVLYVSKAHKEIAIFDNASNDYIIVSDYTNEASNEDIEKLFG